MAEYRGVSAGKRNKYITYAYPAEKISGSGSLSNTPWTPFCSVWARITNQSGGEAPILGEVIMSSMYLIEHNFQPGLTTKMKILYGNRVLEVLNIEDYEERHRWMRVVAKESTRGHGIL